MAEPFRWKAPLAGLAALVIGVGFGRYAYTALMPALILDGRLTESQAGYTAAINLIGYVLGALVGPQAARRLDAGTLARFGIAATLIGLAASALPWGIWWLSAWRFAVGLGAGIIMACGVSLVLVATPTAYVARASGIVFAGVGLGTAVAGIAVPLLLNVGIAAAWLGLVVMGVLLLPIAWPYWPSTSLRGPAPQMRPGPKQRTALSASALAHVGAYFLYGVGLMPHTIFWVDYVARGIGAGLGFGGALWVLVGAGAVSGPLLAGAVASRFGFKAGLLVAFPVFAFAIALPMATSGLVALALSSLLFGIMIPAVPALIAGRSRELLADNEFAVFWGTMTAAVSLGQGLGGYVMAAVYDFTQSFASVFLGGAALTMLGTVLCIVGRRPPHPHSSS